MSKPPTLEQFQGCLIGQAVADALGAPWEGMPGDLLAELRPAERIVAHVEQRELRYTDDTQMMIGVVETLLAHGAIDVDALAAAFAENYDPARGYGSGARRIISAIGAGEDWRCLAATIFNGEGSLGNGAAMRVAPLGVLFSHDLERVVAEAARSSAPTHTHPIGIDSARLLAVAAALAARSARKRFKRGEFLEALLSYAETDEFQWQIDHALQLEPFESLIAFGNSVEAHRSVMTSIVCFCDSPDDYSAAISRALGQGNDADTLAAMTGALAGARLGLAKIPVQLVQCLEEGEQGRSYLLTLAERLWQLAKRG
jgi:poly(ADP-ribose) glycohydrolase ARH3